MEYNEQQTDELKIDPETYVEASNRPLNLKGDGGGAMAVRGRYDGER